jgi:hypothetical protein
MHLGMGCSGPVMISFPYHCPIFNHYGSHQGIGAGSTGGQSGQFKRSAHIDLILMQFFASKQSKNPTLPSG